jgi:hypothetical protein
MSTQATDTAPANAIARILTSFVAEGARTEFIATIKRTRDSFDGVSATHWSAWDMLLTEVHSVEAELSAARPVTVTIIVTHVDETDDVLEHWVVHDNGAEWDDETIDDLCDVDGAVDERAAHYAAEGFDVEIQHH